MNYLMIGKLIKNFNKRTSSILKTRMFVSSSLGRGYYQNAANQRGQRTRSSYIEYHGQSTQPQLFTSITKNLQSQQEASALIKRQRLSSPTQTSQCKSYKVVLNALNFRPHAWCIARVGFFLQFCRNWSRLTFKKLRWDVKSISACLFFCFLGFFSYEGQKLKLPYNINISIWYFSDCKLLADSKNVKFCCLKVNFNHWRSNKVKIYEIFKFRQFLNILTCNIWSWAPNNKIIYFWNQRAICNQKKYHIDV
jgi:hypothetical protein